MFIDHFKRDERGFDGQIPKIPKDEEGEDRELLYLPDPIPIKKKMTISDKTVLIGSNNVLDMGKS